MLNNFSSHPSFRSCWSLQTGWPSPSAWKTQHQLNCQFRASSLLIPYFSATPCLSVRPVVWQLKEDRDLVRNWAHLLVRAAELEERAASKIRARKMWGCSPPMANSLKYDYCWGSWRGFWFKTARMGFRAVYGQSSLSAQSRLGQLVVIWRWSNTSLQCIYLSHGKNYQWWYVPCECYWTYCAHNFKFSVAVWHDKI